MRRNLLKLGVGGMMVGSVMIPCSELVSIRVPHHMSACKRQRSPSQQRLPADKRGCALGVPGAGPPHPEELIPFFDWGFVAPAARLRRAHKLLCPSAD